MKSLARLVIFAGLIPSVAYAQPARPVTPAAPAHASAAGGATAAPATDPATGAALPPEEEDLSMTFHAARPVDMQAFATGSLQEISIGKAKARYALNLFGDVGFGVASKSEGELRPDPAFAVGVMDMLFSAELEGKIVATSEISFQYEPNNPLAELERLHLRWNPNKYAFVEAGRFHTDIGYWNVAYHHGKWLQLPIERPRSIALHGGLLPTHWIGVQGGLKAPVGKGSINLIGSMGSARDPIGSTSHQSHGSTNTPFNGGHLKLETEGLLLRDLHMGVAGIYDRIASEAAFTRPALPDQGIDEYVGNVFIAYPSIPVTLIAEAYEILHKIPVGDTASGLAGAKWRTYGVFALAGYSFGKFTPYVKGEYVTNTANNDNPDPFYVPEPKSPHPPAVALKMTELTLGMRIDTSVWSALKVEYRATKRTDLGIPLIHAAIVNWSFGI